MRIPTGYEIKQLRLKAGLTQLSLAKRVGVSQGLIARIERDDVDPRVSTLNKILDAIEDAQKEVLKARDVMSAPVRYVDVSATVDEAIDIMNKYAISQLPVLKVGIPVGLISEKDIMEEIENSDNPKKLRRTGIDKVMKQIPPIVGKETDLRSIYPLLEYNPCVVVMEKTKVVGIVTRSNIMTLV